MRSAPAIPAYFMGAASIAVGLNCFFRPTQEYGRFGLPLEPNPSYRSKRSSEKRERERGGSGSERRSTADEGRASPLIHLKGIREATYGLTLIALRYLGHDDAVTAFTGIVALAGLGDGVIIWLNGGDKYKKRAFGHWGVFIVAGGWAVWRAVSLRLVKSLATRHTYWL
ncbi:hypothetical protein F4804DRAFT_239231 [Jackrogersella minutella]|nr:hypothetical protein F4804DRAFT_239231 [Jackrogersella minutella]